MGNAFEHNEATKWFLLCTDSIRFGSNLYNLDPSSCQFAHVQEKRGRQIRVQVSQARGADPRDEMKADFGSFFLLCLAKNRNL